MGRVCLLSRAHVGLLHGVGLTLNRIQILSATYSIPSTCSKYLQEARSCLGVCLRITADVWTWHIEVYRVNLTVLVLSHCGLELQASLDPS